MDCSRRVQIETEFSEASAAFEKARDRLQRQMGVSSKPEYDRLNREVEEAWATLQRVRHELDHHIREHSCLAVL